MTLASVRRRFRPLLRINDWAALELTQQVEAQREVVRQLDTRLALARGELDNWRLLQQRSLTGATGVDRGGYGLASQQAGDWLRVARDTDVRRGEEAGRLQELNGKLLELKRRKQVIERRRDEVLREREIVLEGRQIAAQDDLWLNRRST